MRYMLSEIFLIVLSVVLSGCNDTKMASSPSRSEVQSESGEDILKAEPSDPTEIPQPEENTPVAPNPEEVPEPEECGDKPVCGVKDGFKTTYLNKCLLEKTGAKFLQNGKCPISCKVVGDKSNQNSLMNFSKYKRYNFLHKNVAVDPGNTTYDPSALNEAESGQVNYFGVLPKISDSTALDSEEYKLNDQAVVDLIRQGVSEIEFMGFAHQYGSGHDQVTVEFYSKSGSISYPSNTNIYGVHQSLSLRNLKYVDGKIYGDPTIYELNFGPKLLLLDYVEGGVVDPRDADDYTHPFSALYGTVPEVYIRSSTFKNMALNGATIKLKFGALNYDSVQYRTLRGSAWSQKEIQCGDE